MKKEYVTPTMVGERFSADEYVAACITGVIQCAYPGNGSTNGNINEYDDYNGHYYFFIFFHSFLLSLTLFNP